MTSNRTRIARGERQEGKQERPPRTRRHLRTWWQHNQRASAPYLFLLPFLALYAVFMLYPVFAAFRLSFYEAVALDTPSFVGLDNYAELLQDPRFLQALRNTTAYALATILVLSPLALLLALTIRSFIVPWANLQSFYRITFFLPFITSFVVVALMFGLVLNADFGLLNSALRSIGLPQPNWLRSETFALPAVASVAIWMYLGVNSLYFLAGLQQIPEELHEAATVDGAGRWQTFWHVTLPLLRPVMLFVVVQNTIFSYQLFEIPFLLTSGGPSDATLTLAIYLYEVGFQQFNRGYASAIGYSMAIIAVGLAAIQLLLYRRLNRGD